MFIDFLIKKNIKDYTNTKNKEVRARFGIFASIFGIITNTILILIKLFIGLFINSISIITNAIDSLSDFSTNIISLVSFKISKKSPDKEHPFGHERIEYVAGLIVSLIITFIGITLLVSSIKNMISYKSFYISDKLFYITLIILIISIFIKIYQYFVYKKLAKNIDSTQLKDLAIDSLTDTFNNSIIIIGLVINFIFLKFNNVLPFSLDSLLGIIESIIIIIEGIKLVKVEIDNILGKPVDKEFVGKIEEYINEYDKILGTHDAICHMYGKTSCFMTIHVEVDENSIFREIDEYTEQIERDVYNKFNVNLTIHMDPVLKNNEVINLENQLKIILEKLDKNISYHDFRIEEKNKDKYIIFDLIIPYGLKKENNDIEKFINDNLNNDKVYKLLINFDHPYSE